MRKARGYLRAQSRIAQHAIVCCSLAIAVLCVVVASAGATRGARPGA